MNDVPNKWKKHLVLVAFGFKTEEELKQEVMRYSKEEVSQLTEDLHSKLEENDNRAYILSFVPKVDFYKLPNYLVEKEEDIAGIVSFAEERKERFSEIWCCEKTRNQGKNPVIGRIALQTGCGFRTEPEHRIEQVWSVNHREIEKYETKAKMDYLRASREGWNRRYQLEQFHVVHPEEKEEKLNDFISVARNIEQNREKVEELLAFLKEIGIEEIGLEYMLTGDKFKFIDWDTAKDKEVINCVFCEKEREVR